MSDLISTRRQVTTTVAAASLVLAALAGIAVLAASPASAAPTCQFTTHGSMMTLSANCQTTATILVPSGLTLNGDGHTITAVDPISSQFEGPVVTNAGSRMNVKSLTIAGAFTNATCNSSSASLLRGVEFLEASGSVQHTTITGINKGPGNTCNEGNGIVVNDQTGGPYTVKVQHDTVTGFQNYGIYAQGNVSVTISHNTITALPSTGVSGISAILLPQMSGGKITHNTVSVPSSGFAAINIDETSHVTASSNIVTGAMVIYSDCFLRAAASDNVLSKNHVQDAAFAVQITADSNSSSTCPSQTNDNTVKGNTLTDSGGTVGVNIFVTTGGPFTGQADDNVVTGNTITGFSTPIGDGGTNTVIAHNHT
jgi:hypothetical protein